MTADSNSIISGFGGRPEVSNRLPTVLVVDDDPRLLAGLRGWLDDQGFHVICAETSKAALSTASSTTVDVALVDYRLRGRENGLSLGRSLFCEYGVPFILISGFLNTRVTVLAMRLGAFDVLDKPLTAAIVVKAVSEAIASGVPTPPSSVPSPIDLEPTPWSDDDTAPRRLAWLVLRGCEAKRDPKKVSLFAKAAVVSSAVFRSVCDLCAVRPRDACDLGRVLRAISLSIQDNSPIISHFSVGDSRTAERLMRRAGLDPSTRRIELREFFYRQELVDVSLEFIRELGHLTANSPLFFSKDE
jgi:ActR/RegA family two-component response regulator